MTKTATKPVQRPAAAVEAERLLTALNKQRALEATARDEVATLALARSSLIASAETDADLDSIDKAEARAARAAERASVISARMAEELRAVSQRADAERLDLVHAAAMKGAAEYRRLVETDYADSARAIAATLVRLNELAADVYAANRELPPGRTVNPEAWRYGDDAFWGPTSQTTRIAEYVTIEHKDDGTEVAHTIGRCHDLNGRLPAGAQIRFRDHVTFNLPVQRFNPPRLQEAVNLPGVTQASPAFHVGSAA